jgi:hypothetical protein
MWRETELFTEQKALFCYPTIMFISQIRLHPYRLDNHWPLSEYKKRVEKNILQGTGDFIIARQMRLFKSFRLRRSRHAARIEQEM